MTGTALTGVRGLSDLLFPSLHAQPQLLATLAGRYRLELTHFQSHYLPQGWQQRLYTQGPFGQPHVYLVDAYETYA